MLLGCLGESGVWAEDPASLPTVGKSAAWRCDVSLLAWEKVRQMWGMEWEMLQRYWEAYWSQTEMKEKTDNCSGWLMRRGTWLSHRKLECPTSFYQSNLHYFSSFCQYFIGNVVFRPAWGRRHRFMQRRSTFFFFCVPNKFSVSFSTAPWEQSLSASNIL